jgi:hypothetical protein
MAPLSKRNVILSTTSRLPGYLKWMDSCEPLPVQLQHSGSTEVLFFGTSRRTIGSDDGVSEAVKRLVQRLWLAIW